MSRGFCGLGLHIGVQPRQHLLAFLAALDLDLAAVLLALTLQSPEHIDERFELSNIHHIDFIVGSDVCKVVRMNTALIQIPDTVKIFQTFAQATTHKREAGRLDADVQASGHNVAVLIICAVVVQGAVDAIVSAQVMLTGDAVIGGGANMVDREAVHCVDLLFFSTPIVYSTIDRIAIGSLHKLSLAVLDGFCAKYTKKLVK